MEGSRPFNGTLANVDSAKLHVNMALKYGLAADNTAL